MPLKVGAILYQMEQAVMEEVKAHMDKVKTLRPYRKSVQRWVTSDELSPVAFTREAYTYGQYPSKM